MEAVLPLLALACPIGMGVMMLSMHRSSKKQDGDEPD